MRKTWTEAKDDGDLHYFGSVCDKHPEMNGERITATKNCVTCYLESVPVRTRVLRTNHRTVVFK